MRLSRNWKWRIPILLLILLVGVPMLSLASTDGRFVLSTTHASCLSQKKNDKKKRMASSSLSANGWHDVQPGGATGTNKKVVVTKQHKKIPSFYWAVFHNWMYFLSLGFNLINIPFMIRTIVDGPGVTTPSPGAIALSGRVESVDKLLTFAGIGLLSALSDKYGRKPLMIWSSIGFMITNLIQANCRGSIASLYLADFIDGCSSCMLPVCQAYVVDCSAKHQCAANLGIFQGLSGKH